MADRSIRASDGDRERVVEILRDQTGQGRLTLDEFEERMSAAYAAKTWDDLRPLTRDLPIDVSFDEDGQRVSLPSDPKQQPSRPHGESAPKRALDRLGPAALIAPALIGLLVFLVVAEGFPPFIFFALFWVLCARGCRPRRVSGWHQAGR